MGNRSRNYQSQLIKELQDPQEAAAYLEAAIEDGTTEEFLLALRNVAEAKGLLTTSQETNLNSENLYKILSNNGNPQLSTLVEVLKPMGLKLLIEPMT